MTEEKQAVTFERKNKVGWVRFSRPERLNALSPESMRELWAALSKLEADSETRAVVFTGQGEAFCAGMDMAGLKRATPLAARRRSREMQMLTSRIAELSLPTIAAVNGVAMGVGLEICLACDLAWASTAARFAFPEVRLGMIPCAGGTQRLARLIGLRRARDMVLTGRVLSAEQALEWGLVNEVAPADELLDKVGEVAEKLAQGGRIALFQATRCLNHSLDMDLNRGLEYETECFTTCFSSGEPAAGLGKYAESSGEKGGEEKAAAAGPEKEREEEKETAPTESEETQQEEEEEYGEDIFE